MDVLKLVSTSIK